MQTIDSTVATTAVSSAKAHKATLVLVHGAWCGGWMWQPTVDELHARGIRVKVIKRLPSTGLNADALGDLAADVAHVDAQLSKIDGPVVLCGHSYGGMVITELASHTAVTHSIYLTAFWPGQGESLVSILGGGPPPDWQVIRDDGAIAITDDVERATEALFADLGPARATAAYKKLVLQSLSSFLAPSNAPPRSHGTTYILCTQDQAIPLAAQEAMSAPANTTIRLNSAHCPQLSHPKALAKALAAVTVAH